MGDIHFTPEGRELCCQGISGIQQSHTLHFLEDNMVLPDTAEEEACHIEHVISEDTFNKISKIALFL